MRRFWLLSFLLFPLLGRSEDATVLEEARVVMSEGLQRELPSPSLRERAQWPTVAERKTPASERGGAKQDALGERVRNEASVRARAAAEERRTAPDNQPGVGQSRTKAAKGMGPPDKKPPKP